MKIFIYVTLLLNPLRHSVLFAAKVHWTICLSLTTSGGGLTLASLKMTGERHSEEGLCPDVGISSQLGFLLECLQFLRAFEKVVMEGLNDFSEFLSVNHKTDVHE